jgi:hypothetical protein
MKLIFSAMAFVVGVLAALKGGMTIEQGSDGNSITHVHVHIGLFNIVPTNFNDNSHADAYDYSNTTASDDTPQEVQSEDEMSYAGV